VWVNVLAQKLRATGKNAGEQAWCEGNFLVQLGSEPLFKKSRSFSAFDAAANGVQCAAAQAIAGAVKAQPVWQVEEAGQWLRFEFDTAEFEEALLENEAEDFFAK
jgi:hypothetical protein